MQSNNQFYRVVTQAGRSDYDQLMQSGLYSSLTANSKLVEHTEISSLAGFETAGDHYKILHPAQIPFISYPYEWSFSQLRDAALLTLEVQKVALEHGMTTKDASAYNVQFVNGRPILIDTLSFEIYSGQPVWSAYRQFCQHFLAPLALMAYVDPSLNLLLRDFIDGLPLDMASRMLPTRQRLKAGLMFHLVLHGSSGRSQRTDQSYDDIHARLNPSNRRNLLGLVDSLERAIKKLQLPSKLATTWGEYYRHTNYSDAALNQKKTLVKAYLNQIKPGTVWDLGGNDGTFSRSALASGASMAVCFDIDPLAVEKNYLQVKSESNSNSHLLPLRLDLTNPSPALGWANRERDSIDQRADPSNTVLALALVHHLAIADNLPFALIAEYFSSLGRHLIIEFVPKTDSKVRQLLRSRADVFGDYDQSHFEAAFKRFYEIIKADTIKGTDRRLYLMRLRSDHAAV